MDGEDEAFGSVGAVSGAASSPRPIVLLVLTRLTGVKNPILAAFELLKNSRVSGPMGLVAPM